MREEAMSEQKTEQKEETANPAAEKPAEASAPAAQEPMPPTPALKAILGRKVGMTRLIRPTGEFIPVTVLEAGPCPVVQVKTKDNDGYDAVQIAFEEIRKGNANKTETGHFAKAGLKPHRYVREIRLPKPDAFQAGQSILVSQFAEGDVVDVSGVNKGKGFAGGMKRHRFSGLPASHGASDKERSPGSSGRERVWPGKRGPGHMGAEWSTVQRVKVVAVDAEKNLLLIQGAVPGPNGGCVTVQQTSRPRKFKAAPKAAPAAKKSAAKQAAKPAAKPAAPAKK
jgi:large subunit ribosomal protein L3